MSAAVSIARSQRSVLGQRRFRGGRIGATNGGTPIWREDFKFCG